MATTVYYQMTFFGGELYKLSCFLATVPTHTLTFCNVLTSSCLRFISASVDCLRSFFNNTATGRRGGRKEKRGEMRREGEISGKDKEVSMKEQVAILVVYQPGPSLTLKKSGG